MDFKNVDLNDYCFYLELHKSMFFIDMLKDTYEFTLKGDEVDIFKKLKSGISEPITRKELIYSIQVEMVEKYKYSTLKKKRGDYQSKKGQLILTFYHQFQTVDSIHKAIENIVYLEKYLEEVSDEEEEDEGEQVGQQKSLHVQQLEEQISQLKTQQIRNMGHTSTSRWYAMGQ